MSDYFFKQLRQKQEIAEISAENAKSLKEIKEYVGCLRNSKGPVKVDRAELDRVLRLLNYNYKQEVKDSRVKEFFSTKVKVKSL